VSSAIHQCPTGWAIWEIAGGFDENDEKLKPKLPASHPKRAHGSANFSAATSQAA
jgi:hypothetical protein